MKYDYSDLVEKQKVLDNEIIKKKNLNKDRIYNDKVIALLVELNETINEIRFFKYWSNRGESKKEVILEEFVDVLHFIFSIGISVENTNWLFIMDDMKKHVREIYFDLVEHISKLRNNKDKKLVSKITFLLSEFAWSMNFSMEDIIEAYNKKNKINFERLKINY